MCCQARGCFITHFTFVSISICVLLITVYSTDRLCGRTGNPTCYGAVQNMTLIYRNVTESVNFNQAEMLDKNMKYVFQMGTYLTEIKGYDKLYCLRNYEIFVMPLKVGSTYLVHTFYYEMYPDSRFSYVRSGEKLAIYQESYDIDLTGVWSDREKSRIEMCFKPIRIDDAVLLYLAMSASLVTIIIEIIIICTLLPCKRHKVKKSLVKIFKS